MDTEQQIQQIQADFAVSKQLLTAIGDETRQIILTVLMVADQIKGLRVGEITAKTFLSQPAVSHHLTILLQAGIIARRKSGTMNFYTLNLGQEFQNLLNLVNHIEQLRKDLDC